MSAHAPDCAQSAASRGVPLLVTAELPPKVLAWADAIRNEHYPPERNRLRAHVTLFHGLPPSARDEVCQLLGEMSGIQAAPSARISGLMDLGEGTAFAVESSGIAAFHERLAERLHGVIQQKDARPLRLHVTVQNKVLPSQAAMLQQELAVDFKPKGFQFAGLGLYGWDGQLWNFEQLFRFRGPAR